MISSLLKFLRITKKIFSNSPAYIPRYRLIEIYLNEQQQYEVTVQLINKNLTVKMKPEEILAEDDLVDRFSPRDIRALTYLGYLEINSPKYQILAKRLAEIDDRILFALKQKGKKDILVKTAAEIMNNKEIINQLPPSDANIIGYTVASESIASERKEKQKLWQK